MADLAFVGVLVAVAGIGIMIASLASHEKESGGKVRGGGVILLGPIPIVFGTDAKWASYAVILAIVLMIVVLATGIL